MEQNESLRQTLHQIAPNILKNVYECELREWGRERESAQIFTNAFGVISEQQMHIRHKKLQHLIFCPQWLQRSHCSCAALFNKEDIYKTTFCNMAY